jgi:hypothetical protein
MNDIPQNQCSICGRTFPDVGAGEPDDLIEGEFTENPYCENCLMSTKAIKIEEKKRKQNLKFFSEAL